MDVESRCGEMWDTVSGSECVDKLSSQALVYVPTV